MSALMRIILLRCPVLAGYAPFIYPIYSIFRMADVAGWAVLMTYPNAKEQRRTLVTSPKPTQRPPS
jgi:hypothetical protein